MNPETVYLDVMFGHMYDKKPSGPSKEIQVYRYKSNPTLSDTDADGYTDNEDLDPRVPFKYPVLMLHGFEGNTASTFGAITSIKDSGLQVIDDKMVAYDAMNEEFLMDSDSNGDFNMSVADRNGVYTASTVVSSSIPYYNVDSQEILRFSTGKVGTMNITSTLVKDYGYNIYQDLYALNYPNQDFVWKSADLLEWYIEEIKNNVMSYPTAEAYFAKELDLTVLTEGAGEFVVRYYNENLDSTEAIEQVVVYNALGLIEDIFKSDFIVGGYSKPFEIDLNTSGQMRFDDKTENAEPLNYKMVVGEKKTYVNNYQTPRLKAENQELIRYYKHSEAVMEEASELILSTYLYSQAEVDSSYYYTLNGTAISLGLSEGLFEIDATEYNPDLAELSIQAAMYAYDDILMASRSKRDPIPYRLLNMLDELGFNYSNSTLSGSALGRYYDDDMHNNSYVIAHKTIWVDGVAKNLIGVFIRGTDSIEWQGNFEMWEDGDTTSNEHYSFDLSATDLVEEIENYVTAHGLTNVEDNKLWITGHSRGAAVSNLVAAELNRRGTVADIENLYAYTFATPNVTKELKDGNYDNIYNFVNKDDFVTQVPLQDAWDYKRYGHVIEYSSSEFSNSDSFLETYRATGQIAYVVEPIETLEAIEAFEHLAGSVDLYYNETHWDTYNTFRDFAFNVIGKAAMQDMMAGAILARYAKLSMSAYKPVANFFMVNAGTTILFAHQTQTYYGIVNYHNNRLR